MQPAELVIPGRNQLSRTLNGCLASRQPASSEEGERKAVEFVFKATRFKGNFTEQCYVLAVITSSLTERRFSKPAGSFLHVPYFTVLQSHTIHQLLHKAQLLDTVRDKLP